MDSELPEEGPVFLLGDGFASWSPPKFHSVYRDIIVGAAPNPNGPVRAYSYSAPRIQYFVFDTNKEILYLSDQFQRHYFPSPRLKTVFVPFSLAAAVFIHGLAGGVRESKQIGGISRVILLQPAFAAELEFVRGAWSRDVELWPMFDLISRSMQRMLVEAIETLRDAEIPIHMLYWPDDQVLHFSSIVPSLEALGVDCRPLKLDLKSKDYYKEKPGEQAFYQHAQVPYDDKTKEAMKSLLSEII